MRYIIEQNAETNFYHIKDLETGQMIPMSKYQIVLGVIDDKYVIVGRYRGEKEYGLITIDGDTILDMYYDAVYIKDDRIFFSENELMNEMTFLSQYVWHNRVGEYFSNVPYLCSELDYAEIKVNTDEEYKRIDCYGNVIQKFTSDIEDYDYDEWGNRYPLKWSKLWNLLELDRVNDKPYWKIALPCGLTFTQVSVEIIFNNIFAIYRSGYNAEGHWVNTYFCLLDESGKVLHFDLSGFTVNHFMFNDRLVINDTMILDAIGNKYMLPEGYDIAYNSDKNGFVQIYKDNKRGYMNNRGEIVVPAIYDKINPSLNIDEDYFNSLNEHTDDAFEGDTSARWNID